MQGYVGDLALIPGFNPAAFGITPVNNTLPGCDPFPGGRVCTRAELLAMYNNPAYRPYSPNSGPLYSNIAYNLLGLALEKVYSKTFEEVVEDLIITPLGLEKTTFIPPPQIQTQHYYPSQETPGSCPTSQTTIPQAEYGPHQTTCSSSSNRSYNIISSPRPQRANGNNPAPSSSRCNNSSAPPGKSYVQMTSTSAFRAQSTCTRKPGAYAGTPVLRS